MKKNQNRVHPETTNGSQPRQVAKNATARPHAAYERVIGGPDDSDLYQKPDGSFVLEVHPQKVGQPSQWRHVSRPEAWQWLCDSGLVPEQFHGDVAPLLEGRPVMAQQIQDPTPESEDLWIVYSKHSSAVKKAMALLDLVTGEMAEVKEAFFDVEWARDGEGLRSLSSVAIKEIHAADKALHAAVKELERRAA